MLPTLKMSGDRKVANLVTPNGKQAKMQNAFGLPSGIAFSCPGATTFCEKICYAGRIERLMPNVRNVVEHNWNALKDASFLEMVDMLDHMIIGFERECDKRNAPKSFRIHWDGDFFSRAYARAWATVVKAHKSVEFWVYTRSFGYADELTDIPNLVVYLSADPVNIANANDMLEMLPGTFLATVADTFAEARETIVDTDRKVYDCPENGKRLPLIDVKGSACQRCGVCVKGRGDVTFAVKKK